MLGLLIAALCGCAATDDLAHTTPIAPSNILETELTIPRAGTAHLTLYRVPKVFFTHCDALVQVSFHSVPGGRIADVAKLWPLDRLDIYLDPGYYRLDVFSSFCGNMPPVDVDVSLKAGDAATYRVFTDDSRLTITPEPAAPLK